MYDESRDIGKLAEPVVFEKGYDALGSCWMCCVHPPFGGCQKFRERGRSNRESDTEYTKFLIRNWCNSGWLSLIGQ